MEAIDKRLNGKNKEANIIINNDNDEDFKNLGTSSGTDDESDVENTKNANIIEDSSKLDNDTTPTKKDIKKKTFKSKSETKDKPKKLEKPKIIFNVSDTKYDVVKFVGKKIFKWKLSFEPEGEWDILWTDNAVQIETLAKMQSYQKINHFPGMYSLARKNHLGRNLMRMKKAFPDNYKFFPPTWLLPAEYNDFKMQFTKKKNKTFIIKPEASCQGRGIFLTRTHESINCNDHYVAQRYIHKPYLIEGLKFDLRIYVLLAGCDPLRIFVYNEGLARFATEEYIPPSQINLDKICMHLTNYAINKDNPNFIFNEDANIDDVGHKRSLTSVFNLLESEGHDINKLWKEIYKIIIKTFCSVQPILSHSYKSCQPDEPYNNMCFELLGFDIMLDHKLKPWLIEVNHTPSFTTDTPLDRNIKKNVIRDTLVLMNISIEYKIKYKNKKKQELQKRVLTGKKSKFSLEEKQNIIEAAQKERDDYENKNLGGFKKIYQVDKDDPGEDYEEFIKTANKWWEEWTGTTAKKNPKKTDKTSGSFSNQLAPMTFGMNSNTSQNKTKDNNLNSQKLKTLEKPPSQQGSRKQATTSSNNNGNSQDTQNTTANCITNLSQSSFNSKNINNSTPGNLPNIINEDAKEEDETIKNDYIIPFVRNNLDHEEEFEKDFTKHPRAMSSSHDIKNEDDVFVLNEPKLSKKYTEASKPPLHNQINQDYIKTQKTIISQGYRARSQNQSQSKTGSTNNITKIIENDGKYIIAKKLLYLDSEKNSDPILNLSDQILDENSLAKNSKNSKVINISLQEQQNIYGLDNIPNPAQVSEDFSRILTNIPNPTAGFIRSNTRKQEEKNNGRKASSSLIVKNNAPVGNFLQPKLLEFKLNGPLKTEEDIKGLMIGGQAISNIKTKPLNQTNVITMGVPSMPGHIILNKPSNTNIQHFQDSQISLNKFYSHYVNNKIKN